MAVRKLRRKDKATGKVVKSRNWHIIFADHHGREHSFSAGPDRGAAISLETQTKTLVACRTSNHYPQDVQGWIDKLPNSLKDKFRRWDLLTGCRVAVTKPLKKHLADWKAGLLSKGITEKQADQLHARVQRIFDESGFSYWPDVDASKTMQTLDRLKTIVRRKNKETGKMESKLTDPASDLTKRHHLRACKQFSKWMVEDGRASQNPLEHLTRSAQVQNPRRALSIEEIQELLKYTQTAKPSFNISGPERALVYRVAIETGLRAEEIHSLKRPSFDFENRTVRLDSKDTKNRKDASLPLRASTVGLIKDHLSHKMPNARAFRIPSGKGYCNAGRMLKKDLEKARAAWIKAAINNPDEHRRRVESDFMKIKTTEGKLDFHALRHTCSSLLNASGTNAKVIQSHMRHATLDMTMSVYTHAQTEQSRAAVESLPEFEKQASEKTGTDDLAVGADGSEMPIILPEKNTPKNTPVCSSKRGESCPSLAKTPTIGRQGEIALQGHEKGFLSQNIQHARRESNPQPSVPKTDAYDSQKTLKQQLSNSGKSDTPKNTPVCSQKHTDLQEIIDRWEHLPEHIKQQIIETVRNVRADVDNQQF